MHTVRLIGVPVSLTIDGDEAHLHIVIHITIYSTSGIGTSIVGWIRTNHLRVIHIATIKGSPLLHIFIYSAIAAGRMRRVALPLHHVVGSTMDMHDRHLASGRRVAIVHWDTAHWTEGCHLVGKFSHTVIRHHAAHGES